MKDAKGHGSDSRGGRLSAAARDNVIRRKSIDQRHYGGAMTETQRAALSVTPSSGTRNVINAAQSAARQGLGVHSAGVHQVGQRPLTLASASAAGTNQAMPPPVIRGTR